MCQIYPDEKRMFLCFLRARRFINIRWSCLQGSWCILVMHDEPQDLENVFLNILRIYLTEHFYRISVIIKILRNIQRDAALFFPSWHITNARFNLRTCSDPGDVTFPPLPQALNDSWFGISSVKAQHFNNTGPLRNHADVICKLYELLLPVWR